MGTKSAYPGVTRRERQMALDLANQLGLPTIRGRWFWVDPTSGVDGNNALKQKQAEVSIEGAYDLCTTGEGDGIILLASGITQASTSSLISAAMTWDKHGITVFGVCSGNGMYERARVQNVVATLTLPTLINLSGNNNRFENIFFVNEGTDALALGCITITGARNTFVNCHILGGFCTTATANEFSLSLGAGAQENYFYHCIFGSDTIDRGSNANCELYINGAVATTARNYFERCRFTAMGTAAGTHVAIKSAAATSMGRHMIFKECDFEFYCINKGADAASVFGGTGFNTAKIYMVKCSMPGYAAWDSAGTTNVYTDLPVGAATGGLAVAG